MLCPLAQHIAHRAHIGFGYLQVFTQLSFALAGFFREDVRGISLAVFEAVGGGTKALRRAFQASVSGHGSITITKKCCLASEGGDSNIGTRFYLKFVRRTELILEKSGDANVPKRVLHNLRPRAKNGYFCSQLGSKAQFIQ